MTNLNLHIFLYILQVFLHYSDEKGAIKAKEVLNGRKFGGNTVLAVYYPEDKFLAGKYDN